MSGSQAGRCVLYVRARSMEKEIEKLKQQHKENQMRLIFLNFSRKKRWFTPRRCIFLKKN